MAALLFACKPYWHLERRTSAPEAPLSRRRLLCLLQTKEVVGWLLEGVECDPAGRAGRRGVTAAAPVTEEAQVELAGDTEEIQATAHGFALAHGTKLQFFPAPCRALKIGLQGPCGDNLQRAEHAEVPSEVAIQEVEPLWIWSREVLAQAVGKEDGVDVHLGHPIVQVEAAIPADTVPNLQELARNAAPWNGLKGNCVHAHGRSWGEPSPDVAQDQPIVATKNSDSLTQLAAQQR
mmetsp:Transcript_130574/g.279177  ORF Transcript_130574/g.279177 Transcript_130574/m.279177 type:complete len:235 (+) Transcript_130574:105-809(+)